jgi:hypothetical protein
MQIAITVLLSYNDPICSARRCALALHQVVADSLPKQSDNNRTYEVVRSLHRGGTTGDKVDLSRP